MLKNCFGEEDLELYEGSLELKVDDWTSLPAISLREAVILANPKNDFHVGCCNCKTGCKKDLCSCRKFVAHLNVMVEILVIISKQMMT